MSALCPKDVADMIEKRLRGEIAEKQLAQWAWEAHWKDETSERSYDEAHCEVLAEVISTLAHSETEGFELEENELRELWQKLQTEQLKQPA
jgi:hypothetical protein